MQIYIFATLLIIALVQVGQAQNPPPPGGPMSMPKFEPPKFGEQFGAGGGGGFGFNANAGGSVGGEGSAGAALMNGLKSAAMKTGASCNRRNGGGGSSTSSTTTTAASTG